MVLQEPKVEFVPINLSIKTEYGSCPENTEWYGTGGGQYCRASQVDAAYCPGWDNDIDWSQDPPD